MRHPREGASSIAIDFDKVLGDSLTLILSGLRAGNSSTKFKRNHETAKEDLRLAWMNTVR